MLRYTARNGTTFQFEPEGVSVFITPVEEAAAVPIDLDDLREFLDYLEQPVDATSDADAAAVSAD